MSRTLVINVHHTEKYEFYTTLCKLNFVRQILSIIQSCSAATSRNPASSNTFPSYQSSPRRWCRHFIRAAQFFYLPGQIFTPAPLYGKQKFARTAHSAQLCIHPPRAPRKHPSSRLYTYIREKIRKIFGAAITPQTHRVTSFPRACNFSVLRRKKKKGEEPGDATTATFSHLPAAPRVRFPRLSRITPGNSLSYTGIIYT